MIKIVGFEFRPFVQRVTALLEAREISQDVEFIDLSEKPRWFLDISPTGQVRRGAELISMSWPSSRSGRKHQTALFHAGPILSQRDLRENSPFQKYRSTHHEGIGHRGL